jgi:hypothetical protein
MAGYNQKGPSEAGAMTGKKMGKCTNFGANLPKNIQGAQAQGVMNTVAQVGRGLGKKLGLGQGQRMGRGAGGMGQGRGMGRGTGMGKSSGRGGMGRGTGMGRG